MTSPDEKAAAQQEQDDKAREWAAGFEYDPERDDPTPSVHTTEPGAPVVANLTPPGVPPDETNAKVADAPEDGGVATGGIEAAPASEAGDDDPESESEPYSSQGPEFDVPNPVAAGDEDDNADAPQE